jgi:DNA-directed RNA polymerase subunit RPC12/RpoP
MPRSQPEGFNCTTCDAPYRIVRVEAEPSSADRKIACRVCGAPLQGRDGPFVLKYFLVGRAPDKTTHGRVAGTPKAPSVVPSSQTACECPPGAA